MKVVIENAKAFDNPTELVEVLKNCLVIPDRHIANDGRPILLCSYQQLDRLHKLGLLADVKGPEFYGSEDGDQWE